MNLFNRANHFRMISEFDRADEYCERILDMEPTNADAYLGKPPGEVMLIRTPDAVYRGQKIPKTAQTPKFGNGNCP